MRWSTGSTCSPTPARPTHLIRELQVAADEGMSVVSSSPFRVRHRGHLRRMVELVDPLDRALRSTRVLVRQVAVTAYHRREVPQSYVAARASTSPRPPTRWPTSCRADRMATAAQPALLRVGEATGRVERSDVLAAEAILAQLRSIVVDLLLLTGMDQMESTDALPPPPR